MRSTGHKQIRWEKNEVAISSVHAVQQWRVGKEHLNIQKEIFGVSAWESLSLRVLSRHPASISDR